ncbi:MAG: adaptor protein MecA [Eubacterium sp.]|nr:adaptor protein MecA [Eubacterium sp.]
MKFAIVNDTTLRCMITEQEMDELGFDLDDLVSDKSRAQDLLQLILEDAEEETGFRMKEMAAVSVEATMLPGKGLSLLISDGSSKATMQDKIRRFHDAIMDYAKISEETQETPVEKGKQQDAFLKKIGNTLLIRFDSLDLLIAYCRNVMQTGLASKAYILDEEYYLIIKEEFTGEQYRHLGGLALEYGKSLESSKNVIAYLEEHGELLIGKHAIDRLHDL